MKMRAKTIVQAVVVSLFAAGLANAAPMTTTVAGWDFSQYRGAGSMSVDNVSFVNTLSANYSNRVSVPGQPGCGPAAAAYGTLYMNGAEGSSLNTPGFGSGIVQAVTSNIRANILAPANVPGFPGSAAFNSLATLATAGQAPNTNALGIGAVGSNPDVVFEADLTPDFPGAGTGGAGWSVSFGGQTTLAATCAPNCDSTVGVEYSIDGASYQSLGNVVLTPAEAAYELSFPGAGKNARVRLNLNTDNGKPIIDNVAINARYVPEPSMLAQIGAGVVGLLALARRRA